MKKYENQLKTSEENKSYDFFTDKKLSKKNLNLSIASLFLPIIAFIFLYLEGQLSNLYEHKLMLIIVSIVIIIFIHYNYKEIMHLTYYWVRPIRLKNNHLQFLESDKYTTIDLDEVSEIKMFKKRKIPNLLEFKSKKGKVLYTIYLKGFSYAETNKIIVRIKLQNPDIKIS